MGLYDRDYGQSGKTSASESLQMQMIFPKPTPIVLRLIIANTVIFLVMVILKPFQNFVFEWFSVHPANWEMGLQIWRLITYQFLHDTTGYGHIFFNMLGLYFFGSMLEPDWGSRRFLSFYLLCGAAGGVLYTLLVFAGLIRTGILFGASGAIYGILGAVAILFPRRLVYIWGIVPIPMMLLTLIYLVMGILVLYSGENVGSELVHLTGMAAGAGYVLSLSLRASSKLKIRSILWQRRIAAERELRIELDRILEKVYKEGIHNLTSGEKRILRRATKAEQSRIYKK